MKKITLVLLISTCLMSCGGVKPTMLKSKTDRKEFVVLDHPYSKEIGETLISSSTGSFFDAIRITKGSKVNKYYADHSVPENALYEHRGYSKDYELYYSVATGLIKGVAIPRDGSKPMFFYDSGFGLSFMELKDTIEYTKEQTPDGNSDYFKQEIIYNGKAGNTLKLSYREYVNSMARPAFSQDLQYDLSESNVIGFKGVRIEIIKADNVSISFKVLKGFE